MVLTALALDYQPSVYREGYVCMYLCMYICTYVGETRPDFSKVGNRVSIYMYVCIYVCMYVCRYI